MRTAPSFSIGVSGATNRAGGTHDANGNLLSGAGITNSYDVDNRLIATSRLGHSAGYHYSARNERIVVYENGARQFHFYGVDGLLLGVYTPASEANPAPVGVWPRERVHFHGRLIQIGIDWVATDRLGSVVRKGSTNYNYAPYGQEIGGATENNTAKFATYTRDTASGYDYALNRYYNSQWGRFTSPDPYMPGAPQRPSSWNYYAYTEGDPINFSDPEGLDRIEACDPRYSRTGHVDADCALIPHGGGGGGAFEGFRSTYDSVRWGARMVGHRFSSLLGSFRTSTGSTGSQPSVTSKITYPEHDPPMNANAASVLSRVGSLLGL